MRIDKKASGWLVAAGVAIGLLAGAPAAADEGAADPFEADPFETVSVVEDGDLHGLRGAGCAGGTIFNSCNTMITTSSSNTVNASIGSTTITVGGDITAGSVVFSGEALAQMSGVFTGAFGTAPGAIATATTAMTVFLQP